MKNVARYSVCWSQDEGDTEVASSHQSLEDARSALCAIELARGQRAWIWDEHEEHVVRAREAA